MNTNGYKQEIESIVKRFKDELKGHNFKENTASCVAKLLGTVIYEVLPDIFPELCAKEKDIDKLNEEISRLESIKSSIHIDNWNLQIEKRDLTYELEKTQKALDSVRDQYNALEPLFPDPLFRQQFLLVQKKASIASDLFEELSSPEKRDNEYMRQRRVTAAAFVVSAVFGKDYQEKYDAFIRRDIKDSEEGEIISEDITNSH